MKDVLQTGKQSLSGSDQNAMRNNSNKLNVPQAKAANKVGVDLQSGYNGHFTSRMMIFAFLNRSRTHVRQ